MKKRTRLSLIIMSLCLVITLGVLGIFAVKTLNMSVGGNITFSADGIAFTVSDGTFKTTAGAAYDGILSDSTKLKGFAMDTNTTQTSVQTQIDSWTNLDLRMSSLGDAVLHFSITNDMPAETLYAYFTISHGENTNNNMSITQTGSGVAIAPTQTQDYTITFDVLDDSINAALTGFKVDILLTRTEQVVAENQTPSGLVPVPEEKENELVSSEMTMNPAYANFETDGKISMRFSAKITPELKTELESNTNKKLTWLLAPLDYYDKVNPQNETYIDWINVFTQQNILFQRSDINIATAIYDDNTLGFRFSGILYNNMNRKFLGLLVIETANEDGSFSYQYTSLPSGYDYRSFGVSLSDVISQELNKAAKGLVTHTAEQIEILNSYQNQCADKASGLTAATDDGSKFDFSINLAIPQSFAVGTTVPMEVRTNPYVKNIHADYVFSDPSVAKIDTNGNLVTLAAGTTTISVYVFGEVKTITITVA